MRTIRHSLAKCRFQGAAMHRIGFARGGLTLRVLPASLSMLRASCGRVIFEKMKTTLTKQEIVEKALSKIDDAAWRALQDEYTAKFAAHGDGFSPDKMFRMERNYSKYFDLDQWFNYHARLLMLAGLHETEEPMQILDLGCGSGIFMFLCQCLGHAGVGLDIDSEMYRRMADVLGVDWRVAPVLANTPLGEDLTGFDMITALAIKFDRLDWGPQSDEPWGLEEWQFFILDAASRLNPGGHMFIKPNYWLHPKDGEPGVYFKDARILDHLHSMSLLPDDCPEFLIPRSAVTS